MTETEILEVVLANLIQTEERSNPVVQPVIFGGLKICRVTPTNGSLTRLTVNWPGLGRLLERYDNNEITLYETIQTLIHVIAINNKTIVEDF